MRYWIMFFFFVLLFSLPLCLRALSWIRRNRGNLKREGKNICQRYRYLRKPYLILLGVYLVATSALLTANVSYLDDLGRVDRGYRGWQGSSRYFSSILSNFVHGDTHLTDISPLPQLMAIALLAAAGMIVIHALSEKKRFSLWELAASIPLGLSPYYLACLSFKFDAPYMALSVLAAVAPILLLNAGPLLYTSAVALGTFVVCTSYQASSGIFPMLVAVLCVLKWVRGEDAKGIGRFLLRSVAGYLAALIVFKVFAMQPWDTYVSNALPEGGKLLTTVMAHLGQYYSLVLEDFRWEWLALAAVLGAMFVYEAVRDAKGRRFLALLGSAVCLLFMLLLAFGIYPALEQPLYRPRAMYGFGALIALLSVAVAGSRGVYPGKLAGVALSWMFIVFALTYGNAIDLQYEYADFRITAAIEDLDDLGLLSPDAEITVQIDGTIGHAPAMANMRQDYQLLNKIVRIPFEDELHTRSFGPYLFYRYYGLENVKWDKAVDLTAYDLPVLKENIYHTIRGSDGLVLIELKECR